MRERVREFVNKKLQQTRVKHDRGEKETLFPLLELSPVEEEADDSQERPCPGFGCDHWVLLVCGSVLLGA